MPRIKIAIATVMFLMQLPTPPQQVTVGVDPDTSATAPISYSVQVDAGQEVNVGNPPIYPSCVPAGTTSANPTPCVQLPVALPSGLVPSSTHTITVAGYNMLGKGATATVQITLPSAVPSAPKNLRVIR